MMRLVILVIIMIKYWYHNYSIHLLEILSDIFLSQRFRVDETEYCNFRFLVHLSRLSIATDLSRAEKLINAGIKQPYELKEKKIGHFWRYPIIPQPPLLSANYSTFSTFSFAIINININGYFFWEHTILDKFNRFSLGLSSKCMENVLNDIISYIKKECLAQVGDSNTSQVDWSRESTHFNSLEKD